MAVDPPVTSSRSFLSPVEREAIALELKRLAGELGSQAAVGRALGGFTQAAISGAILHHRVGASLARAVEQYTGSTVAELVRKHDLEAPTPPTSPPERWVERPVRYENLRKVVTSLRGERPDEFLDEVLVSAALYSPTDLPEASWKAMLEGFYAEWRGKAVPEPIKDDPVAEAMAKARKKHAKKKGN